MNPREKRWLIPGLILVVLFQTCVLVMVYLNAQLPLWTGQPILLKTEPVDPRSLFRGNYAYLNYAISQIPPAHINNLGRPRQNQKLYVTLKPGPDNTYVYGGVSFEKPGSGIFIRGRIASPAYTETSPYRIKYGIEAFFAPKATALDLEKRLRKSAAAEVWINSSGKAALSRVIAHES